ncbi:MAG TPA: hypothetical protein VEQ18_04450 [Candidatus Nitrosocosmicus sp.]|nr:hypothetical protein [Candidatus Nitrosocosmicus sp.]
MANPIEMADFLWLGPMTGTVDLQPHGFAEAGKIYPGPDGDRFYYGNYDNYCIYVLVRANMNSVGKLGKFFKQNRFSFATDISEGGPGAEVTRRLHGSKAVIEGFMDVFMGVLSCAGGPVAMGITGMNILVATGNITKNYDVYKKAIEVLLYNRQFIEKNARQLYYVIFAESMLGGLEKMLTGRAKEALLNAVPGPKIAGKVLGVFLGKIGEDKLKVRLKMINKLFKDVLIKVADHASQTYPNKLSNQQVSDLAKHVIKTLNEPGLLTLPQITGESIIREVVDNCLGLQNPLKKISAALDKIQ